MTQLSNEHDAHKTHHLKIYPEHFSAVLTGVKRAELRKNDRDYKVGDTLHLLETPKGSCSPTGEFVNAVVTHIADVSDWLPGYVLLSIERESLERRERDKQEPVAWTCQGALEDVQCGSTAMMGPEGQVGFEPLYAAPQPAPVAQPVQVPDALEQFAEFMAAESIKAGDYPDGWQCKAANAAHDYAQACRAAMLKAEPVSQPYKLPDGYVLVPKKLTADNGAKSVMSGEFSETKFINCPECFGDEECETCDGSGRIEITLPVSWTNIKAIWEKAVEHFAAAPQEPTK